MQQKTLVKTHQCVYWVEIYCVLDGTFATPIPLSRADRILAVRHKEYTILNLRRPKKYTLALWNPETNFYFIFMAWITLSQDLPNGLNTGTNPSVSPRTTSLPTKQTHSNKIGPKQMHTVWRGRNDYYFSFSFLFLDIQRNIPHFC